MGVNAKGMVVSLYFLVQHYSLKVVIISFASIVRKHTNKLVGSGKEFALESNKINSQLGNWDFHVIVETNAVPQISHLVAENYMAELQ